MSVWSGARGTVILDSTSHFSLKKYTLSLYDEVCINVEHGDVYKNSSKRLDEFTVSICLSGQEAMDFFIKWVEGIPGSVDMVVELRVLT